MTELDIELFTTLVAEDLAVPVDLESRLLAEGIDTDALRLTHEST